MRQTYSFKNVYRHGQRKGWQLRKHIAGMDISKHFSDSRYGSRAMSLVAAILARELFFNQR